MHIYFCKPNFTHKHPFQGAQWWILVTKHSQETEIERENLSQVKHFSLCQFLESVIVSVKRELLTYLEEFISSKPRKVCPLLVFLGTDTHWSKFHTGHLKPESRKSEWNAHFSYWIVIQYQELCGTNNQVGSGTRKGCFPGREI